MSSPEGSALAIEFGTDGLIPVVVQDADSDAVLMTAFMNADALRSTRETGRTHFWSRSRQKLWRKGETSGHEQIVDEIFVNCESNSLLITVRQIGAACHTGYPTCYYRRLEDDGSLTVVKEREFDPSDVYDQTGESLADRTRRWYGAYELLRDNDLSDVSGTSRRLREREVQLTDRVTDELRELAGVLRGTHRHADVESDARLEGTQSLYWLALTAVQAGVTWDELRPDRALATSDESIKTASAATMLERESTRWASISVSDLEQSDLAARVHAAMALVAQACRSAGVPAITLINRDLDELRSKSYLAAHFADAS